MTKIVYDEKHLVDTKPFDELVGEEFISFIAEHAPRKVTTRLCKALHHYDGAMKLVKIDEEMGAIRLIAGEEELIVAIFEWLKLNADQFPEHKDFVSKYKNHVVKLAFYPVLVQFRLIVTGMLRDGVTMDGLEEVLSFTTRPVVDGKTIRLALFDSNSKELVRLDPLHISVSRGELEGKEVVPLILETFARQVQERNGQDLKAFLSERADFRNKLLYASDAGSLRMADRLEDLIAEFKTTYHDLLWVLLILLGGKPISKEWGIASQFMALYREVLVVAGVIKKDGTIEIPKA